MNLNFSVFGKVLFPAYLNILNFIGQGVTVLRKAQQQAVTKMSLYFVIDPVRELLDALVHGAPSQRGALFNKTCFNSGQHL